MVRENEREKVCGRMWVGMAHANVQRSTQWARGNSSWYVAQWVVFVRVGR